MRNNFILICAISGRLIFSSASLSWAGLQPRAQPIRTQSAFPWTIGAAVQKRRRLPPVDPTYGVFFITGQPSAFPEVNSFYIALTETRPTPKGGVISVATAPKGALAANHRDFKMSRITIQGGRVQTPKRWRTVAPRVPIR